MLKILENGDVQRCPTPIRAEGTSTHVYPVYRKDIPGGTLVVNSFTDEVWVVGRVGADAAGLDAVLSRLAEGPSPDVLIREAERQTERIRDSIPYQIALCPTYSCNLRCTYCFQQSNPLLDKRVIDGDNLAKFLSHVDGRVTAVRAGNPNKAVVLQLFGGEPFTRATKSVVREILAFCRSRKVHLAATSNGVALDDFFEMLLPYHGYIANIGITIDGVGSFHDGRRRGADAQGTFDRIVRNVNVLIRAGIKVTTSLTLDASNLGQLAPFLDFAQAQGWVDHPCIDLSVARVDDRKYETGYEAVMSEAELLKELLDSNARKNFPRNIRFAFLNTSLALAKRLHCTFNQNESGRDRFKYCWASSKRNEIVYVDAALDVYRCTYTAGDKKLKVGTLFEGFSLDGWRDHGTWGKKECRECSIGGYCSGGCGLSARADFQRNCLEEKKNFDYFIENVMIPRLPNVLPPGAL